MSILAWQLHVCWACKTISVGQKHVCLHQLVTYVLLPGMILSKTQHTCIFDGKRTCVFLPHYTQAYYLPKCRRAKTRMSVFSVGNAHLSWHKCPV